MLRCASIGLGWWGGMHASAIHGKSELLRIEACHNDSGDDAIDSAAMRGFAERFGARPFARFDELLKDETIDAVIITTPHSRHVPQIIAAAMPTTALCETSAATNPTSADSTMLPSSDRLITPARSVIVSPRLAITSGVAPAGAVRKLKIALRPAVASPQS